MQLFSCCPFMTEFLLSFDMPKSVPETPMWPHSLAGFRVPLLNNWVCLLPDFMATGMSIPRNGATRHL